MSQEIYLVDSVWQRFLLRLREALGLAPPSGSVALSHELIADPVDQAFMRLYQGFLFTTKSDFSQLVDDLLPEFEEVGIPYLFANNDLETTRKYFRNLRNIWLIYARGGRLGEAEGFIRRVLQSIEIQERRTGIPIHKGPMYYFWGGTALLQGDLDKGFFLMHASYEEDVRVSAKQPTPSTMFVSLHFENLNQAFGPLVTSYSEFLNDFIAKYRFLLPSQLTKEQFRRRFLEANPNIDTVFTFTHTLARVERLRLLPQRALLSGFAGQYELNLLFDLGLVVDSGIKSKYSGQSTTRLHMPQLLEYLASSRGWGLLSGHLSGMVQGQANTQGFDQVLASLLDRKFPLGGWVTNLELESDMAICYLLRNRAAHDPSTSPVVSSRWGEALQSVLNVVFLVAETLYP